MPWREASRAYAGEAEELFCGLTMPVQAIHSLCKSSTWRVEPRVLLTAGRKNWQQRRVKTVMERHPPSRGQRFALVKG
jgi:hypothetical protein